MRSGSAWMSTKAVSTPRSVDRRLSPAGDGAGAAGAVWRSARPHTPPRRSRSRTGRGRRCGRCAAGGARRGPRRWRTGPGRPAARRGRPRPAAPPPGRRAARRRRGRAAGGWSGAAWPPCAWRASAGSCEQVVEHGDAQARGPLEQRVQQVGRGQHVVERAVGGPVGEAEARRPACRAGGRGTSSPSRRRARARVSTVRAPTVARSVADQGGVEERHVEAQVVADQHGAADELEQRRQDGLDPTVRRAASRR